MAPIFSFVKTKGVSVGPKNNVATKKPCGLRRLVGKTKNLFRSSSTSSSITEPFPAFRPLTIPEHPETTSDLQRDINEGLSALSRISAPLDGGRTDAVLIEQDNLPVYLVDQLGADDSESSRGVPIQLPALIHQGPFAVFKKAQTSDARHEVADLLSSDGCQVLLSSLRDDVGDSSISDLVRRTSTPEASTTKKEIPVATDRSKAIPDGGSLHPAHCSFGDEEAREGPNCAETSSVEDTAGDTKLPWGFISGSTRGEERRLRPTRRRARSNPVHKPQLSVDHANIDFFQASLKEDSKPSSFDPLAETETFRLSRSEHSSSLQAALAEQKAALQSGFEKRLADQREKYGKDFEESHDSTARLHEIEMQNEKDDHEAAVKELRQTIKDLRGRLAKGEKACRDVRRELKLLRGKCAKAEQELQESASLGQQLQEHVQTIELALQQRADEVEKLRAELQSSGTCYASLAQSTSGAYAQLLAESRSRSRNSQDRYERLQNEWHALAAAVQEKDTQLEMAKKSLVEVKYYYNQLKDRHDLVVSEKSRDLSWHNANNLNGWTMKPMFMEDAIREATVDLRQMLDEKNGLIKDLQAERESKRAANRNKFRKMKGTVACLWQEQKILSLIVEEVKEQREHWAARSDEAAEALAAKFDHASAGYDIADRYVRLQRRHLALENQLTAAQLRGDDASLRLAVQKRHEKIKLDKRDAAIVRLQQEAAKMTAELELETSRREAYQETVESEIPDLEDRNRKLQESLEHQVKNSVAAEHQPIVHALYDRISHCENKVKFWEHTVDDAVKTHQNEKMEWDFFHISSYHDLVEARRWRDASDALERQNRALRQRFAEDLIQEPLVVEEHVVSAQSQADDCTLERIDALLLEHWGDTYKSLPKHLFVEGAPPWEYVRIRLEGETVEEQRQNLIAQRHQMVASLAKINDTIPNDHTWIDDPAGFHDIVMAVLPDDGGEGDSSANASAEEDAPSADRDSAGDDDDAAATSSHCAPAPPKRPASPPEQALIEDRTLPQVGAIGAGRPVEPAEAMGSESGSGNSTETVLPLPRRDKGKKSKVVVVSNKGQRIGGSRALLDGSESLE